MKSTRYSSHLPTYPELLNFTHKSVKEEEVKRIAVAHAMTTQGLQWSETRNYIKM
jgi:hypothetical protein